MGEAAARGGASGHPLRGSLQPPQDDPHVGQLPHQGGAHEGEVDLLVDGTAEDSQENCVVCQHLVTFEEDPVMHHGVQHEAVKPCRHAREDGGEVHHLQDRPVGAWGRPYGGEGESRLAVGGHVPCGAQADCGGVEQMHNVGPPVGLLKVRQGVQVPVEEHCQGADGEGRCSEGDGRDRHNPQEGVVGDGQARQEEVHCQQDLCDGVDHDRQGTDGGRCLTLHGALDPGHVEVVDVPHVKRSLAISKVELVLAPEALRIAQLQQRLLLLFPCLAPGAQGDGIVRAYVMACLHAKASATGSLHHGTHGWQVATREYVLADKVG
mmetsp:Transcript_518/g.1559  ORF Transcript_518/g.1559 Transcript_518/m.1559 type:complete len:322 (-) Transcript_518:2543-3508(-)